MIRTSRRTAGRSRAAVAALAAAGVTLLAGCQTGQQAQTAEEIPTIDGTFARVGSLALRDVKIEYPESGSWPQGSDARLQLIIVNEGGNDINAGRTPEALLADFKTFVEKVRTALPQTRIALSGLQPSPARWASALRLRS